MKRFTIIACSISALCIVAVITGVLILRHTSESGSQYQQPISFPNATSTSSGSSSAASIHLTGKGAQALDVADFVHATGTVAEPYVQNEYIVAEDCSQTDVCDKAASVSGARITYDSSSQLFTVLLLAEPLRESRIHAEKLLESALRIAPTQLCSLNATIGTINGVNGTYAGRELGFSMCPGTIVLP